MTELDVTRVQVPVLSADEALAEASRLAADFAVGAALRDRERILPHDQITQLAASGLLAITVPAAFGGADLPFSVVAEVIRRISVADPNIGQIPHSHFVYLNQLRLQGSRAQQALLFGEVLAGTFFGNAQSEVGTKHVRDYRTTLVEVGDHWHLNGTKFYCTGAIFADRIPVLTHLGIDGPMHVAWVDRNAPGVEIIDDWDAVGQRTTASGTVRFTEVEVRDEWITNYSDTFTGPTTYGSYAQLMHSAIDAGIARAALDEAARFVTSKSRPYPDAVAVYGVERAAQDPVIVRLFGEMELRVRSAEALLSVAGAAVDAANADLTEETASAATLAVAAARASTTEVSVAVASGLFEVAGTRSALTGESLDRHWRNARVHTLHDPAAWKLQHLGRWAVEGLLPPRHGQL
ncbi:SfnB family sulfur acquisition oxidoreductase [Nocardioides sp.]|uniref:SfnB family sulfur acquisition oxidoreductase n=1 Tax=Nocardioides sp. TaxID=35761 RepID=UPI0026054F99|nr:SfnB family sulfur acquisition oxidoreductase [Nocardioides sp.]